MKIETSVFQLESATPRELLQNNIETQRLETIPLKQVISEDSIIDESHALDLAASMGQKRGQLTPICVRARLDDQKEVVYDVIDGFHRTAGKKRSGDHEINATVVYGCSDEEMYDLRILAASSVRSVQFPRIIHWITNSFNETVWAKKGLTVSQAFGIAVNDSLRSYLVELEQEEVKCLKEWVKEKCLRWGRPVNSVYYILKVSESADPNLVKEVREATGGHSREITITQSKLALVATVFPGEGYWCLQRVLLEFAISNKLRMSQLENIVEQLRGKIRPNLDEVRYKAVVGNVDFSQAPQVAKNENNPPKKEELVQPTDEGDYQLEKDEPTIEELESIEFGKNSFNNDSKQGAHKKPAPEAFDKNHIGSSLAMTLTKVDHPSYEEMSGRIKQLEEVIDKLNEEKNGNSLGESVNWWQTATYLTPIEKRCLVALFEEGYTMSITAKICDLNEKRVIAFVRSAFAKHSFSVRKPPFGVSAQLYRRDQEEI